MHLAVCTMAHNEAMFLPIWASYYGRAVGPESLYIVDHGTTDGSIGAAPRGANIIRIPRDALDEYARTRIVQGLVTTLLHACDAVIFCDTDELIIPDPARFGSLQDVCALPAPLLAPVGLNVFQAVDREAAIDVRRPILGQRHYCRFRSDFCKPVIAKTPVRWTPGMHFATEPSTICRDVYLFHLKSIDRDMSLARLQRTRPASEWHESNIRDNLGHHHRASDAEHLQECFLEPLRALDAAPDTSFDFSRDIERLVGEVAPAGGFLAHRAFSGKVAAIPERFFGLA